MRIARSISRRWIKYFGKIGLYKRNGAVFLLDPNNHVDYRVAANLPFEVEQLESAQHYINDEALSVFLDVGANIGIYTAMLGLLPKVKKVHAFEPVAANYNQLCANIFLNKINSKVCAHRFALGNEGKEAVIYIDPVSTGCSRLNPDYSGNKGSFTQEETIKIVRLDDYLSLVGERIYMKIDVEGHAVEALKGMEKTLANNYVIIQAELLDYDKKEIVDCLYKMGYVLFSEIDVDGYFCPASSQLV